MDETLGKKIQLARQQRGFTQAEVEQRLQFPQKSITRIESAQRQPTTLELVKLAELFHISIGDFFENDPCNEDAMIILHRVAPGIDQDPSIREEVHRCIHLCKEGISLEKLLGQPARQRIVFSGFEGPSNAAEAIRQGESGAKEERKRLGINTLPIHDIAELLSSQGIWCAATHLPPEMSGLFLCHLSIGGMVILVNAKHPIARQRFSYAHEYGHALFDSDQTVLISDSANASELLEKRANAFAAAFLMPEEGIAEVLYSLNKGLASRTPFSVYDVSTHGVIETEERQVANNQKISPQDIAFLAYRFGVSYQAMAYRLASLRYLSRDELEVLLEGKKNAKDYLYFLGLKDFKLPNTSPLPQQELQICIARLVIEAYRQEKISRGRVIELSKSLNLSPEELLQLANNDE